MTKTKPPAPLSETQKKVMQWLACGWSAFPGAGNAVLINDQRICNTNTMNALKKADLVSVDPDGIWHATKHGKIMTRIK